MNPSWKKICNFYSTVLKNAILRSGLKAKINVFRTEWPWRSLLSGEEFLNKFSFRFGGNRIARYIYSYTYCTIFLIIEHCSTILIYYLYLFFHGDIDILWTWTWSTWRLCTVFYVLYFMQTNQPIWWWANIDCEWSEYILEDERGWRILLPQQCKHLSGFHSEMEKDKCRELVVCSVG